MEKIAAKVESGSLMDEVEKVARKNKKIFLEKKRVGKNNGEDN